MYGHIEKHFRSKQALEQDINQYVFISMITSKLPKEVLIQLEIQKRTCNKLTVKDLREFFKNYVAAKESERAEQEFYPAKTESTGESYKPVVMVSSAKALMARS